MFRHILKATAIVTLFWGGFSAITTGCGADGPDPDDGSAQASEDDLANGGAGGSASPVNLGGSGGGNGSGNGSGSGSGSGSGGSNSGSGSGAGTAGNCSIMSSNTVCASCMADNCCMVINAAMDEDLFSAIACLDCYLEGDGAACCDETVGKNNWIEECAAFNCDSEC